MLKIITPVGLSSEQLKDIKQLEDICSAHERLRMKLNWEMLENRSSGGIEDFLCYRDNQLIGFLGLYGFGQNPEEIELTGMVHPQFRHRKVFTDLFDKAKKECMDQKAGRILIISEGSSESGIGFALSTGAAYSFSEFRMKFNEPHAPFSPGHGIVLRKAEPRDDPELRELDAKHFGGAGTVSEEASEEASEASGLPDESYKTTYIAELNGKLIGKIGTTMEGPEGYVFGFVIKPEYRGRGYGKETLSLILSKLLSENIRTVLLEVAAENNNALSLYKSCGFKEDTVYNYYELALQDHKNS